jgi:diguanylate cyclase (GGDEF)-like protein
VDASAGGTGGEEGRRSERREQRQAVDARQATGVPWIHDRSDVARSLGFTFGAILAKARIVKDRRLLVIDGDTSRSPGTLAKTLARGGYATHRVGGFAAAMRYMTKGREPDLVVWNAGADRAWNEALRALRAWKRSGFLPVVLVAPFADVDVRIAGLDAGAEDVMVTPWSGAEILARVAALLRIKATQDALEKAKLDLERQSFSDHLTGLYNRRYFQHHLQLELERERRYGEPVSLMMIDLDHFKRVNDRYGHPAGDALLRAAAGVLTLELRRLDVCARWGGEEFAVIMPKTDAEGGAVVAHRVLRAIRSKLAIQAAPLHAPGAARESVRVTASMGFATYPCPGVEGEDALLRSADRALYQAKASGRDRVCFAEPPLADSGAEARLVPMVSPLGRGARVVYASEARPRSGASLAFSRAELAPDLTK